MQNKSSVNPLEVFGVGFLYNTNVNLLPPVEKVAPDARNVQLLPDEPGRFSVITAKYEYHDANNDPEDLTQLELRWFINGVHIPFLDNLLKWNDLETGPTRSTRMSLRLTPTS
jgi:hypothetical protein